MRPDLVSDAEICILDEYLWFRDERLNFLMVRLTSRPCILSAVLMHPDTWPMQASYLLVRSMPEMKCHALRARLVL